MCLYEINYSRRCLYDFNQLYVGLGRAHTPLTQPRFISQYSIMVQDINTIVRYCIVLCPSCSSWLLQVSYSLLCLILLFLCYSCCVIFFFYIFLCMRSPFPTYYMYSMFLTHTILTEVGVVVKLLLVEGEGYPLLYILCNKQLFSFLCFAIMTLHVSCCHIYILPYQNTVHKYNISTFQSIFCNLICGYSFENTTCFR